jgi:hypothetical protein
VYIYIYMYTRIYTCINIGMFRHSEWVLGQEQHFDDCNTKLGFDCKSWKKHCLSLLKKITNNVLRTKFFLGNTRGVSVKIGHKFWTSWITIFAHFVSHERSDCGNDIPWNMVDMGHNIPVLLCGKPNFINYPPIHHHQRVL